MCPWVYGFALEWLSQLSGFEVVSFRILIVVIDRTSGRGCVAAWSLLVFAYDDVRYTRLPASWIF
jgi:hypothetical protein